MGWFNSAMGDSLVHISVYTKNNTTQSEPPRVYISMLEAIIVILVVLWLLGFGLHVGGGLIHLLLVVAVIVLVFRLLSGRRVL